MFRNPYIRNCAPTIRPIPASTMATEASIQFFNPRSMKAPSNHIDSQIVWRSAPPVALAAHCRSSTAKNASALPGLRRLYPNKRDRHPCLSFAKQNLTACAAPTAGMKIRLRRFFGMASRFEAQANSACKQDALIRCFQEYSILSAVLAIARNPVQIGRGAKWGASARFDRGELWRCVARLPPREQTAVLLYHAEGQSYLEIAEIMDVSVEWVKRVRLAEQNGHHRQIEQEELPAAVDSVLKEPLRPHMALNSCTDSDQILCSARRTYCSFRWLRMRSFQAASASGESSPNHCGSSRNRWPSGFCSSSINGSPSKW